jgi:flagellar biosynthetic protein FlhB
MAEGQDPSQRTEEPTQKRLSDARRKGDAPRSQEIVATLMIAAGGISVAFLAGPAGDGIVRLGAGFLARPHEIAADSETLTRLFFAAAARLGATLAAIAALFVGAAILASLGQARPAFAADRLKPSLERLSPAAGFKRVFGPAALFNFAKGVAKIALVGAVLLFALWPDRERLAGLPYAEAGAALALSRVEVVKLIAVAVAAMTAIAAIDYAHAHREWKQRLRMTKEEVRREFKETEGDPQIRARLRQELQSRARRRMMVAVKDATVLVMNPTHYAVALKYEREESAAPVCVAKGLDDIALRLRRVAEEAGVPVVENPPLARALYAAVDLDDEIPIEHYEAVAKVIGFVLGKARTGAQRPLAGR